MSHLVATLTTGERVQIQFQHGKTEPSYYDSFQLGKRTKRPIVRDYTTVEVVHWPLDKNDPKSGKVVTHEGQLLIETVYCYKDDRPNRKVARQAAIDKLLASIKNPEDIANLADAWVNRR